MKIAYFIAPIAVLMSATAFAGHPILMSLETACKQANMVIIADVSQSRKVPEEGIDPFNPKYSKWNDFGFSQCADISKMSTLIRTNSIPVWKSNPRRGLK